MTDIAKKLQQIPNIGPAMAEDLIRLGVTDLKDLKKQNAQELYDRISAMDKKKHDICVLDVFEAAIQYAKDGKPAPGGNSAEKEN